MRLLSQTTSHTFYTGPPYRLQLQHGSAMRKRWNGCGDTTLRLCNSVERKKQTPPAHREVANYGAARRKDRACWHGDTQNRLIPYIFVRPPTVVVPAPYRCMHREAQYYLVRPRPAGMRTGHGTQWRPERRTPYRNSNGKNDMYTLIMIFSGHVQLRQDWRAMLYETQLYVML